MLQPSDLRSQAAGLVGTCPLCGKGYVPGVVIVGLGEIEGEPAFAHLTCMEASLQAGPGDLGWDRAFKSMVPTRFDPTAWLKEGRVRLMAPYDQSGFDLLKVIPGRSYHADPKPHWSFPEAQAAVVLDVAQRWPGLKVAADLQGAVARRSGDRVEVRDGLAYLHARFLEAGIEAVKAIPGARYRQKAWAVPLEWMEELISTAQGHWPELQLTPSVIAQRKLEEQAAASAGAHLSEQVIEYEGIGRLHGYQTEGVRFLSARRGKGILGDDMGLGKTIQLLAYAREIGVGSEGARALFVAPASVRINWAREARKWIDLPPDQIFVCGVKSTRRNKLPFQASKAPMPIPAGVAVVVINYDILKAWLPHLVAARFDLVGFDEAQAIKNSKSARSKMARYLVHGIRSMYVLGQWLPKDWRLQATPPAVMGDAGGLELQRTRPPQDDEEVEAEHDPIVVTERIPILGASIFTDPEVAQDALDKARKIDPRVPQLDLSYPGVPRRIPTTGTPIENRPPDLWHLLHIVDPDAWRGEHGGYKAFTGRYHGGYHDRFGNWKLGPRATNTAELHRRLMGTYLCRRRKVDVLKDLPPKTVNRILLEVSSTELRPYHDLEDEIQRIREDYERQKTRAKAAADNPDLQDEIWEEARRLLGLALGKSAQLRQTLGVCKVPAVVRWMQQLVDAEEPIVVFAYHKDVQQALIAACKEKKLRVGHILAADNAMARQGAIDAFQAGQLDAIVCSIKAAGAGVTLHRASHTLHVERDWNPGQNDQAEDRTHRIGQLRPCFSWYLDVPGTFDDSMEQLCDGKKRDQQLILDGKAIPRNGTNLTQRALLADYIGLKSDDLELT